eukprot:TRINITY_DN16649_c0_g1_i1.p1 TRINITY_DN16649_c0_g1~~TRINITY_DN16649_c0_g1_i1.p1  ORF type:complete len:303 (-),score=49.15 TRINITY_DN16649_c0_g1_i1:23-871(-)
MVRGRAWPGQAPCLLSLALSCYAGLVALPFAAFKCATPRSLAARGIWAGEAPGRGSPVGSTMSTSAVVSAAALFAACAMQVKQRAARRGGVRGLRAFENELGVQPPVGYFDPLGLSRDGDFSEFYRRREAELKNGRVAMYATIGYILPEYIRWPGYISPSADLTFEDCPNGLQALAKVPTEGWLQIIAWCGMYEVVINQPKHPSEPGNYYKGRLGAIPGTQIGDEEKRRNSMNAELANGRLAMMAIIGMFFQDGLTGQAWGDWSLYTDSPLRARAASRVRQP